MTEQHVFTADLAERLDVFLARMLPGYSRSFLQRLCREGSVTVANEPQPKPRTILRQGQHVVVTMPGNQPAVGDIPVIYQDDDVIVLNKPAGMLTHAKGSLSHEFTVGEFMRSRSTGDTTGNRPGIVHRLDRGTSGIIIAAKNPQAKQWLQKQFASRKVKKTYLALVRGHLKEPAAALRLPIERNPKKPYSFRVGPGGKPAETAYTTEHVYPNATLLRLTPTTGRTHQLRVHMAYLGHPIVGDPLYGTPGQAPERMFLHAAEIELTLPSRQRKTFAAPLPSDLQTYLHTLQ